MTVTLFAFLVRRPGMTHDEFVSYWRGTHGPFIRDTPELACHLLSYEQHARIPGGRGGSAEYDGVAVQRFASWADFAAMLEGPAADRMSADELNFLDRDKLLVVFSEDVVTMVGAAEPSSTAGG